MMSIRSDYAIDISRVRGVVDNSNRILECDFQPVLILTPGSSLSLYHSE
ncbi:hypothetical protein TIFTF001_012298 [Ficus carica]|uniref:Uncharacterized protein n=1 Tax=Ficus carica TaxID=3494 RepID=A0AA88DI18_FICCA|nr:hypothetical protein TIFTF001_012298 [Ficus carica]